MQSMRKTVLPLALAWASLPFALAGQVSSPSEREAVDSLLASSRIPAVVEGLGGVVETQIHRMAPGLDPERAQRIRAALARHFAPGALYEGVHAALVARPGAERLGELAPWLTSGPPAEARRIADAYEPPISLEDYALTLRAAPPPEARVQLMLRLARAQAAGPFNLLVGEAVRGAAHTALLAVDPTRPAFRGVPADEVAVLIESHNQQSVLIFLHRYATVPDELIRSVAERYETPLAQWYVDALAQAVGDAVLSAAEQVYDELRAPSRSSRGGAAGSAPLPQPPGLPDLPAP